MVGGITSSGDAYAGLPTRIAAPTASARGFFSQFLTEYGIQQLEVACHRPWGADRGGE